MSNVPIFTRAGENYRSTWDDARFKWLRHSSDEINPGFTEIHQDRDFAPIPCDHPFQWLCPGDCGALIHVSGREMPAKIKAGGLCEDCSICEKMKENQ